MSKKDKHNPEPEEFWTPWKLFGAWVLIVWLASCVIKAYDLGYSPYYGQ